MSWRETLRHALPAGLVLAAVAALWALMWSAGVPRGADIWSHLFKAEFLAGQMHSRGLGAYFSSAWMPHWYLGDPYRTYYPPLTTLVLAPLQYLTGNVVLTARLFTGAALLLYAALTYGFIHRFWGRWQAALGALLALWAPYQLRTLFFEGNYPRVLSLLALPLIAWQTERILAGPRHRAGAAIGLGLAWAWAILAHPQQAYMFAIAFALYIVARLFLEPDIPLWRAVWWLGGLVWGAALTLPWSLPAYLGNELPGVPFLPEVKVETFVASLSSILPSLNLLDGRVVLGSGALLLALLAAIARPEPRRTAFVLAGLAAFWFSLGSGSVAFSLLPLHAQLLPERFLNFTAFALPVAAAGIVPFQRTARPARLLIVVSLLILDLVPGLTLVRPIPYPQEQSALASLPIPGDGSRGRVALLTYPEPTAVETYFVAKGAETINGWALENTPHHESIRRVLGAPSWSLDYLKARFALWDVRTIVLSGGEEAEAARQALPQMGFAPVEQLGPYQIWLDSSPSSRVQRIPEGQMIVAGDSLAPFLAAFPFAEERRVDHLSEIALEDLMGRPAIGLYRFEGEPAGLASAQDMLRSYLGAGGTAVVDLSGMEGVVGRSLDFLDVNVLRLSFDERADFRWAEGLEAMPLHLNLEGLPEAGWSGSAYLGLDQVLGEVELDGEWYPVLGYKNVGAGRAWFVGLNLLYYGQLTGDARIAATIRDLALTDLDIPTSLRMEAVDVRDYVETDRGLSFQAEMPRPGDVLISYTYTPRWEVSVDGEPARFSSYEGLIRLPLPAGDHRVDVRYRPYGTVWPSLGLGLGMVAAALGAVSLWGERRVGPLAATPHEIETQEPSYAPCANCGFRLAEKYPPTAVTYPFNVVSCPICGMRMDDEGFVSGETLGPERRKELLTRWLETHNYDPDQVYERWGFGVDDFFDLGAVAQGSPSPAPPHGSLDADQNTDR